MGQILSVEFDDHWLTQRCQVLIAQAKNLTRDAFYFVQDKHGGLDLCQP